MYKKLARPELWRREPLPLAQQADIGIGGSGLSDQVVVQYIGNTTTHWLWTDEQTNKQTVGGKKYISFVQPIS